MALNSCEFIGNLGKDPDIRSTQSGDKCANISIAVSEKWKDRNGEKKEKTTWVPVVIWGPLADVAERYLRKGSKVFVRGKFTVRKWQDQSGQDRYSTEVVLNGFDAKLEMLGDAGGNQRQSDDRPGEFSDHRREPSSGGFDDLNDDVPF